MEMGMGMECRRAPAGIFPMSSPKEGRRALLRWLLLGGPGGPNLQGLNDGVGALELQPSDATAVALDELVVGTAILPRVDASQRAVPPKRPHAIQAHTILLEITPPKDDRYDDPIDYLINNF